MPGTRLLIEHADKWYSADSHAVKDMSLTVEEGEFMIFVGPSGCGKSTLLRMIAGLERIQSGTISMGERVINRVPPRDRDIAMVFQNYALYPTMKVYDNMAFPLKMRHWKKEAIRRRVTEVAESLGLTEYLNRRPGALSGGQRQRVALGRAMVRQPQLFLMDEPLSNLDAKLRVDMRREIVELQRRLGVTTIYVTHDQTEAMTMGTRIAIMKDGILQQLDTPRAVYNEPANLFVAKFIGSPPMNTWTGTLTGRPCTVGIRPEAITLVEPACPGAIPARVSAVENTGRECMVYLDTQGYPPLAMAADAACAVQSGASVFIQFDQDKFHYFDAETEVRIRS